ncbi:MULTISPECIES: tetratricopeptide repeat-containing sulfotransferase family protein [Sphingomonadales]|nr:tetratricopeptide repeat-containing sulfotransferase family protein [Sphingomonas haloaromaticamans]
MPHSDSARYRRPQIASLTAQTQMLAEAARALNDNQLTRAEQLIRSSLVVSPENPDALRLLAAVAVATGHFADAERLLRGAICQAPGFVLAHADLCTLLGRQGRAAEALGLLDELIGAGDGPVWALSLKAATLTAERRADEALPVLRQLIARTPGAAIPQISYADALQTAGHLDQAVAAYRKALDLDPASGLAWWGLANLRVVRLSADDVMLMERAMEKAKPGLDRVRLGFALGKALGDQGRYEESFRRYEDANRVRGLLIHYDPQATEDFVRAAEAAFTSTLFDARAGHGNETDAPIFIVGMPRAGSTLVEQILASHPMVENLGELFELRNIAQQIAGREISNAALPGVIAALPAPQLREIGDSYIISTRRYRRTDRPFFTDKMPANWQLVPLILLILPKAKIIDVRRDPMACCLSNFTTYFNRHTSFPANLADLGRYHSDYAHLMDHLERVRPGRVYRLGYERLVEHPEAEIRKLLAALDLPFDAACLRPHENQRSIYTPSAQQVRQPINGEGLQRWRAYAPWLEGLRDQLENL